MTNKTHQHLGEAQLFQLVCDHLFERRRLAHLVDAFRCDTCAPRIVQFLTEILPYAPFSRPNRGSERSATLDQRYEEGQRTLQTIIKKQHGAQSLNQADAAEILAHLLDALGDSPDAAAVWIDLAAKCHLRRALPIVKTLLFLSVGSKYFTDFVRLFGAIAKGLPQLMRQSDTRRSEEEHRLIGQRLLQLSMQDRRLVTPCLCSAILISPDWLRIASFVIDSWPDTEERSALLSAIGGRLVNVQPHFSRHETDVTVLYGGLKLREAALAHIATLSALSADHPIVLTLLALSTPRKELSSTLHALRRGLDLAKHEQDPTRQVTFQHGLGTATRCLQARFRLKEASFLRVLDADSTNALLALAYIAPPPKVQGPEETWRWDLLSPP